MCDKLTTKQRRFVEEYCVDFNGAAAAIRVGYNRGGARQMAYDLLRRPEIRDALAERLEVLTEAADVEAIRLLADLKCVALFNVQDILAVLQADDAIDGLLAAERDVTAAVSEVTVRKTPNGERDVKLKFYDKLAALRLLAQIKGMMDRTERVEHTGANGGPIETLELSGLTAEERRARIDELISKRGTGTSDTAGRGDTD